MDQSPRVSEPQPQNTGDRILDALYSLDATEPTIKSTEVISQPFGTYEDGALTMRLVQMGDVAATGTRLSFVAGADSSEKGSLRLRLSSRGEWVTPGRNIKVPSHLVATRLDMIWPISADNSYIRELSDSAETTPSDIVNALSRVAINSNQYRTDKTFSYIEPLVRDIEGSSVPEEALIRAGSTNISGVEADLVGAYLNSNIGGTSSSALAKGKFELQIPYEYDGIDTKIHYKILVNDTGDTEVFCYFFDPCTGQRKTLQPKSLDLLKGEVESTLESIVNERLATQE